MRLFNVDAVQEHLGQAGFEDITVHADIHPPKGVFPPHHYGLPISARKPISA